MSKVELRCNGNAEISVVEVKSVDDGDGRRRVATRLCCADEGRAQW